MCLAACQCLHRSGAVIERVLPQARCRVDGNGAVCAGCRRVDREHCRSNAKHIGNRHVKVAPGFGATLFNGNSSQFTCIVQYRDRRHVDSIVIRREHAIEFGGHGLLNSGIATGTHDAGSSIREANRLHVAQHNGSSDLPLINKMTLCIECIFVMQGHGDGLVVTRGDKTCLRGVDIYGDRVATVIHSTAKFSIVRVDSALDNNRAVSCQHHVRIFCGRTGNRDGVGRGIALNELHLAHHSVVGQADCGI